MKLLPFILLLSIFSNGQDTLTASNPEKILFSLNFSRMNYCCTEVLVQRKELAIQDTIIQLYSEQTGVYKANIKTMKDNFALKNEICTNCIPRLTDCENTILKLRPRCKRRGWAIAIGVPVSIGIGFIAGSIYTTIK